MNNGHTNLDMILERVSLDTRQAFLASRMDLNRLHQDDEFLRLALHLDNFGGVIAELTNGIVPASDNANDLALTRAAVQEMTKEFREARTSISVIMDATRFHLVVYAVFFFSLGALAAVLIELIFSHLHII